MALDTVRRGSVTSQGRMWETLGSIQPAAMFSKSHRHIPEPNGADRQMVHG